MILEQKVTQDQRVTKVLKEDKDLLVQQEELVLKDHKEDKDLLVQQEQRVILVL